MFELFNQTTDWLLWQLDIYEKNNKKKAAPHFESTRCKNTSQKKWKGKKTPIFFTL